MGEGMLMRLHVMDRISILSPSGGVATASFGPTLAALGIVE